MPSDQWKTGNRGAAVVYLIAILGIRSNENRLPLHPALGRLDSRLMRLMRLPVDYSCRWRNGIRQCRWSISGRMKAGSVIRWESDEDCENGTGSAGTRRDVSPVALTPVGVRRIIFHT